MGKLKGILMCLVTLSLFVTGISARAEVAQSSSPTELMLFQEIPIVVTAAKREQPIAESPSAISVITAEDIKQSGATQIDEALRMVPGANFGYMTHGYMGLGGIRGLFKTPNNKIMFLVNGIPNIIEAYGYPGSHLPPVGLEEIDRIEILRGPGSSLYGANAMMGVINVITKKTKDTKGNLASFTAGERGVLIGNYIHGGAIKDKVDYRIAASFDQRDPWGYVAYLGDPDFRFWRVDPTVDYYINDNSQLNFFGSYLNIRNDMTLYESTGPLNYGEGNKYSTAITYTSKEPNILLCAYQNASNFWKKGYIYNRSRSYYQLSASKGVDFQHTTEPFKNDILVWGLNYMQQQYLAPVTAGKRRHDINGIFADNTYKLGDKFNINTGARYDKHPNTGNSLSHRVAFLYFPKPDHRFRFIWASSYRNPDFIESYYVSATSQVYGHEDNKAEKAENFELGYLGKLTKKLSLETNVFYTRIMDYVYFVYTTTTRRDFLNIDDLYEQGTEIELKYSFAQWLEGVLNYTYINQWPQRDMSYNEATSSVLSMTPQNMFNGQLRASFQNGFSANLQLQYRGATDWRNYTWYSATYPPSGTKTLAGGKAERYLIANLRLGYKFKFLKNDAELGLTIFDIFDKQYDDYPVDTSSVGRRITGTFTYKF